jgi:hypothetical protein
MGKVESYLIGERRGRAEKSTLAISKVKPFCYLAIFLAVLEFILQCLTFYIYFVNVLVSALYVMKTLKLFLYIRYCILFY